MSNLDISIEVPALIELEGSEVLSLMSRKADCAIYNVIGFNDYTIKLVDYRQKGLEAINRVLNSRETRKFPDDFCFPALVRISQAGLEILIELLELEEHFQPEMMLWIATDLEEPIPDYEYSFFRIQPRTSSYYSFVSLFNYHRFQAYFDGMLDQAVMQIQAENQI